MYMYIHVFISISFSESIDDDDDESYGDNDSNDFHVGMKLEALDRRFPYFVCVATVADKRGTFV